MIGRWILVLLLAAAGCAAYANSFNGVMLFDDESVIVENPALRDPQGWQWVFGGLRSLGVATLALNYQWGGLDVRGYHAVNLAIHVAAGLVLFGLLRRTLQLPVVNEALRQHADALAFAVALLWLVHPLNTEAVTYIVQRFESLMALCYLLFLYALVRGATSPRSWWWYALAMVALICGVRTKEVMLTAPVVGLLFDRAYLASKWREVGRQRWGFYLALLLPAVAGFIALLPVLLGGNATVGFGVERYSPVEYLGTQPGVLLHYLQLAVAPHRQCFDLDWPVANSASAVVLPGVVILILLGGLLWLWRRNPALAFPGLAFFLILAPTSSFVPLRDLAVEHRMYLPLVAVLIYLVLGVTTLLQRWRPERGWQLAGGAALILVAITLGLLTAQRNEVYHSAVTMWSDVVATAPHNYRAHNNLANALIVKGSAQEAVAAAERAVQLRPDVAELQATMAAALAHTGDHLDLAREHAERAVQLKPEASSTLGQLGFVAAQQRDWPSATQAYERLVKLQPDNAAAHLNLGQVLIAGGREPERALDSLRRARKLDPQVPHVNEALAEALYQQGNALRKQQKPEEAIASYEGALELNPRSTAVHNNLGMLLATKNPGRAMQHYRAAIEIEPRNADAHSNLGNIYARQGRFADAVASYRRALELKPDHAAALRNLEQVLKLQAKAGKGP